MNSSSSCLTPFQLWPPLLSSSQTISALLNFRNSFQQLSKLFISSDQLNSFHLFPAFLNSCQRLSPLLTSSQTFSTHLNSSRLVPPLINSSHRVSPPLNCSHLFLSSSQLLSPLVNSSQLLPTLITSFHRDGSFYTQRSFYTQKLLHREAFTHSKFLHLVRTTATQIAAPKPDLDAKAEKRRFWSTFWKELKRGIISAKMENSAAKASLATFMPLLQYDLRISAAKDTSISPQQQQWGTLTQLFHCDLQTRVEKDKKNYNTLQ